MADPPDSRAAYATPSSTTAPSHLDAVGAEDPKSSNTNIIPTQTDAASYLNTNAAVVKDSLSAADGAAAVSTSVHKTTFALTTDAATHKHSTAALTSHQSGTASEEHDAVSASTNPSLFAKLPGELRNRLYRAYFEDFREQKKETLDIKETASTYLNLLHTDRMIRSEASSIFFKEHFCLDSFVALTEDLEHAMESRIKAVCALVAVYDSHLPISITVYEMVSVHDWMVRQLPLAWKDSARRNLVNKIIRFIANKTHEVFVGRTGSQQQPEVSEDSPYSHMVYVGRKVHVSPRYRIERVDPDAAITPLQKLAQKQQHDQLLLVLGKIAWHLQDEGLDQELEKLRSAEHLCVEGPLAELDWNTF